MVKYNILKSFTAGLLCSTIILTSNYAEANQAEATEDLDYFEMSLEELMNIEVTSVSKRSEKITEAPAAIHVVTNEDIRRSGHRTLPEVLRMVPGIHVAQIDSNKWAITSRGFSKQFSNKLLVLMDGRTLYTPNFSGVYWDIQDTLLEDIERIEVVRGPGGTLWGANAVNGVINIITKKASDTVGSVAYAGTGNYSRAFLGGRHGIEIDDDTHLRVYAKHDSHGKYKTAGNVDNNDDWHVSRSGFRMDKRVKLVDNLTVQGDIYHGDKNGVAYVPTVTSPYFNIQGFEEEFWGGNLTTLWKEVLGNGSSYSMQSYIDHVVQDQEFLSQARTTLDFEFQYDYEAFERNLVTWGLGFRYINDSLEGSDFFIYDDETRKDNIFSAFIQDKITVVPEKLFLTLGTKLEHNEYTGFEVQPNIRGSWILDEDSSVWASVSRAVRTPARNEDAVSYIVSSLPANALAAGSPPVFVTFNGSSDIESEEMIAYEAGYRTKINEDINFDVAAFMNDYSSLRTYFSPAGVGLETRGSSPYLVLPFSMNNGATGETYGVEVASSWQATDSWRLTGSYSFISIDLHAVPGTISSAENEEGSTPKNMLNISSLYNISEKTQLDTYLYYVDSLSEEDVDKYFRLDARLGIELTDGINLDIVGQNLLSKDHAEYNETLYALPSQIGRAYYAKITAKF